MATQESKITGRRNQSELYPVTFILFGVKMALPKEQLLSAALQLSIAFLVMWHVWSATSAHFILLWLVLSTFFTGFGMVAVDGLTTGLSSRNQKLINRILIVAGVLSNVTWASVSIFALAPFNASPAFLTLCLAIVLISKSLIKRVPNSTHALHYLTLGLPFAVILVFAAGPEAKVCSFLLLLFSYGTDHLLAKYGLWEWWDGKIGEKLSRQEGRIKTLSAKTRQSEEMLEAIISSLPEGANICDKDMRFKYWNDQFLDMLNITPDWISTNRTITDLVYYHTEQGEFDKGSVDTAVHNRQDQFRETLEKGYYECEILRPSGSVIQTRRIQLPNDHVLSIYMDVSENRKATTEALVHLYQHNALTGLANRIKFRRELEKSVNQASRNGSLVTVMMLNLDDFRNINDVMGHPVGDEVLKIIARRLSDCARKTDLVAHLNGDEFAMIVTNNKKISDVRRAAERIISNITKPVTLQGKTINIGVSIGITIYPNDKDNMDQLVRNAELALEWARQEGRNNYQLFDRDMHAAVQHRQAIERDLRAAVNTDQFTLRYQPQIDLATRKVIGAEALMRWHHPERGMVGPDQFIPVAEATRLIIPLTDQLMSVACHQAKAIQDLGFGPFTIAVNLSPVQFRHSKVLNLVSTTLKDSGLAPESLELEITEGMVMHDSENVIETLNRFDQLGVKLAIDDFGTGYSSLSYLKRFPVDKLKIDQAFIRDIPEDTGSAAIVDAIIKLAHIFGLKVIAEGMETREQLEYLEKLNCDEVQGYYFSKPVSADELIDWLGEQNP